MVTIGRLISRLVQVQNIVHNSAKQQSLNFIMKQNLFSYEKLRIHSHLSIVCTCEEQMSIERRKTHRINRTIMRLIGHCNWVLRLNRHFSKTFFTYRNQSIIKSTFLNACSILRDVTDETELSEPLYRRPESHPKTNVSESSLLNVTLVTKSIPMLYSKEKRSNFHTSHCFS